MSQCSSDAHPKQIACCYWFTGLSGAGKSTLSRHFEAALRKQGYRTFVLDGDHLREGLNKGLGFSRADRAENIRRIAEVARLMADAGLIVLVSAIAPYQEDRQAARDLFDAGEYFEVFVDTSLATCMARDPKGLYKKAKQGLIFHLTGLDDPYETPIAADLVISTTDTPLDVSIDELVEHCTAIQRERSWIPA
jgi:adenylyl-sulfate kinase